MSLPTPYYQRGPVTLYHGDCLELLPHLPRVDAVVTDPPYGVERFCPTTTYARDRGNTRSRLAEATDWGRIEWDGKIPSDEDLQRIIAISDSAIIWGGNFFSLGASPCWLVWDKDNGGSDFADCELAWTNIRKAVRKFKWRWNGMLQELAGSKKEQRFHPTQKPVALLEWCVCIAGDSQSILDPFIGSGTTAVACIRTGRQCIGIELEEKYCEIAAKRCDRELDQKRLPFDAPKRTETQRALFAEVGT